MGALLQANNLVKEYEGNGVLRNVSLSIQVGEYVAVMGQSGCGKSTLLYNISGMDSVTKGNIFFEGNEMTALSEEEMSSIRLGKMGFVFQNSNLLRNLSLRDNIIFPGFQLGEISRKEINRKADDLMKRTGIFQIAHHDIRKVSGGQLQRATICRALINNPSIVFADEPTGSLNSANTNEIMDIFNDINRDGSAIVLVTHDAKVAARAERVIYLEDGKIKNELYMGKFCEEKKLRREIKMTDWLQNMGF